MKWKWDDFRVPSVDSWIENIKSLNNVKCEYVKASKWAKVFLIWNSLFLLMIMKLTVEENDITLTSPTLPPTKKLKSNQSKLYLQRWVKQSKSNSISNESTQLTQIMNADTASMSNGHTVTHNDGTGSTLEVEASNSSPAPRPALDLESEGSDED